MANKPKQRIDYAGWSVDIFSSDVKIDKLLDAHGWNGFGVYFFLCQMAFGSHGYYYEWSYELCASTARKMGGSIGAGTVRETVDYCLQIGLFEKRLFDRWQVLTSRGIQKSYLVVLKSKRRQGTEIFSDYWLLDRKKEDYQGVVFVRKNKGKLRGNSNSLGVNPDSLGGNSDLLGLEDSKVKERIYKPPISPSGGVESDKQKKTVKKKKKPTVYFDDPDVNGAFLEFIDMRKKIKSPLTSDRAVHMAMNKLESLSSDASGKMDPDLAIKIIDQTVFNNWKSFYPLGGDGYGRGSRITQSKPKNNFHNFPERPAETTDTAEFEKRLRERGSK